MKPSTRIILNTLATYSHSVLSIILQLFSARWVLAALGQADFGLYGVVGSLILLINILNGGMSIGVARFYAFSIGESHHLPDHEATDDLNRWFNTALSIYLMLPVALIIVGWPIGEYAIQHWLTIPPDRIEASAWVFRIALATTFVSLISVPFTAMYNAHQYITELAFFGVLQSIGTFGLAWSLLHVQSDRLIVYALFMMAINVGVKLLQMIRATFKFKACRVHFGYMHDRAYISRLFCYVGWKTLGTSCVVLRGQGIPILVNLYYGPLLNASYSIANRLSTQAISLSTAMIQAFQPALVSAEGKGDRRAMLKMGMQVCKFGTLLVLLFAIPLIMEMDNLLVVWLQSPPEHASVLCQWMLAMLIVDKMTAGQMLAVNAYGKIAKYEVIQGAILFSALPLTWLFFHAGMGPASLGYALFITMTVYCCGRLVFAKVLAKMPVMIWFRQVAIPVLLIIISSSLAGSAIMRIQPAGFLRICMTAAVCGMVSSTLGWFYLLDKNEHRYIRDVIRRLRGRVLS